VRKIILGTLIFLGVFILSQNIASAHEVYVLSPAQITTATGIPPFNMLAVVQNNLGQFTFWAFIGILTVLFVFFISTLRFLENRLDPVLSRLRPYALFVTRLTIGVSFLAAALYQATYGPELPIANTYGSLSGFVTALLVVIGIMTILGFYTRLAATVAFIMYGIAIWFHGIYMLTYINYLGEIIVLLAVGAHNLSIDNYLSKKKRLPTKRWPVVRKIADYLAPKSFAIIRVCFGISLIFASAYAKIVYNNLGLSTVIKYHLDTILGFEPHFLVLGAAIVEILIGTFIIFGIEIRFASLFFEFWLMLSLWFFGEVVWPHIILIGIPIALIMYGYDDYSLEGHFFRKKKYKPVL
jgi:uncharacterized membrane protein YphA (DoxX/SURF4 family)